MESVLQTEMPDVKLFARGKVRDVYDLDDRLLIVATDRISAFDYVLPDAIPGKGKVLTRMSLFWFEYTKNVVPNHFLTANVDEYPEPVRKYRDQLEGRSMLVRKAERIDIECVVRGYISGSLWKDYQEKLKTGDTTVLGFHFAKDLKESQKFDEPIFTPATKEESGHDINIAFEEMAGMVGIDLAAKLRQVSKQIYLQAANYCESRGIILADTKFEFGIHDGRLILIDEILSPDSSRFWPKDKYQIGRGQESFDKQYVRDYLLTCGWDRNSQPPHLPADIINGTRQRYEEIEKILLKQ
ncbi:MAG: phosphoribosylaminoimidazolesuccinocarboxamide synthase [candidate division Zixibacteria bacterium]|nr:phosphoribosylaminoimidazolesuccinocarboxamide synthase [candidate division Zixibacteria bacterium]